MSKFHPLKLAAVERETRDAVALTFAVPPELAPHSVRCPRCGSERTRMLSQFGSTACKAQYRCDACLEPFDYFKPH